ncbi:MAG: hypothetical protein JRJ35_11260 [Deltaproteobacteria bacterium]|nr:hypothetical protein [Deltaproteobacteria bacterium]MBW1924041.1 hypothetical protein [Deltaproteobacteria bacterium]
MLFPRLLCLDNNTNPRLKFYMPFDPDRKEYLTSDEDRLKDILEQSLEKDFILKREKVGYHLLEQRKVRIDFLLYPKQHLIENGFEPIWFGCEVKSPAVKKEPQKNVMDLAKQCIDYTESKIDGIIPSFALMFPSMYHFFHAKNLLTQEYQSFLYYFRSFIQRLKVGTLHIFSPGDWAIRFGSQYYYTTKKGKGRVKNLGTKRHIGSV